MRFHQLFYMLYGTLGRRIGKGRHIIVLQSDSNFIERPNRFIAYVNIAGERTKVHVKNAVLIGASSAVQFFCSFDSSVRNLANGPALSGLLALRLSFSSNASSPCSLKICSDSSENNTASPSKAMRICLI